LNFAVRHGLLRAETALLEYLGDIPHAIRRRFQADQPIIASNLLKNLESTEGVGEVIPLSDVHTACWRHMSIATIDWNDAIPPRTKTLEALETFVQSHLCEEATNEPSLLDVRQHKVLSSS
jgi:hypothetical protein